MDIKIVNNFIPTVETSEVVGGATYLNKEIVSNIGVQKGSVTKFFSSTLFKKYTGIVNATSGVSIASAACFVAPLIEDEGPQEPAMTKALCVKYVDGKGSFPAVTLYWERMAGGTPQTIGFGPLTLGQSVAMPIITIPGELFLTSPNYVQGQDEAIVTAIMM